MKKWLIPLTAISVLLTACDDNNSSHSPDSKPASAQSQPSQANELMTVSVIAPWELNSLSPMQSGTIFQRMNIAETLVETNLQGELVSRGRAMTMRQFGHSPYVKQRFITVRS